MFYEKHVFVCENQRAPGERVSCGNQGSIELLKLLKQKAAKAGIEYKFRVQKSGCLDRCELGPIQVSYPEGKWFAMKTEADVDTILEFYLKTNQPEKYNHLIVADDAVSEEK
ncbi:(2Fe-2S) ferredoxin domain-containing protein [Leptospira bourretii]|uniref:(2Fe-2S) ferredoxin domain-containing protein n=1 Tax=Leptospira bourretii TaxID=2484962 RepID=A0A4R9IPV2_9LEPT|nr:(2Fe-2S) ferredoxin domain-containing protein [Leptospira bourretii]TGK89326.1 (2Fe-2S) ferredoxin domain-containing protein [Leptospira bourretii]TGK93506.1 (2Fe-2S) ferredoxin domain-containing protein [Leptospira bourretii]TGL36217.1 (2Fe-2S) ferredoxin domain-containing protein [Leptospira bourretii]